MAIRSVGDRDNPIGKDGLYTFLSALTRGTDEDKVVKISDNDTVALVTAGENFAGVVRTISQADSLAGVQMDDWAEVSFTHGAEPSVGWNYLVGGTTAGTVKVPTYPLIKPVNITVSSGQTSGASEADTELVGGTIIGIVPTGNQDQLVDNIALGTDGSVTVTLASAATADNTFTVSVLKAPAKQAKKYLVSKVDATNHKCVIWLG